MKAYTDYPFTWVRCADNMPASGRTVLAYYRNRAGNKRIVLAKWINAKTHVASENDDVADYDDATDTYYAPEGWYECIDNWDDYTHIAICEGEPTHWMRIPDAPADT